MSNTNTARAENVTVAKTTRDGSKFCSFTLTPKGVRIMSYQTWHSYSFDDVVTLDEARECWDRMAAEGLTVAEHRRLTDPYDAATYVRSAA